MWTRKLWVTLSFLVIASLACNLTGPAPTPQSTATASVSPTPLPPITPRVIDYVPGRGDELPVRGDITVYFDNPMDRPSVEGAFKIEPAVSGSFEWVDDATLKFKPNTELERASRYVVTIGTAAKSKYGLALEQDISFKAETVGFLEVTQVLPAPDSGSVPVNSALTVMFNRPVVALTSLDQQSALPTPIMINPDIEGTGEWLNTSIYIFKPRGGWVGGITYEVKVPAGLQDTTGGLLKSDYAWRFTTIGPAVINMTPAFNATLVPLNEPISVTFNQPMDRIATQQAFALMGPDLLGLAGTFEWTPDSTALAFYPNQRLSYQTEYKVLVGPGAKAAAGAATLGVTFEANFYTVPPPAFFSTRPSDGEQGVDYGRGVHLYFASPMDVRSFQDRIAIVPTPTDVYTSWSSYDNSFYIGWNAKPSTDYQVTVAPGLTDVYGTAINEGRTISFRTRDAYPQAYFNSAGFIGTYSAYAANTTLFVTTLNIDRIQVRLSRLSLEQFAAVTGPNSYNEIRSLGGSPGEVLREWEVDVENTLNDNILTRLPLASEGGGQLPPGVYALRVEAPELTEPMYQVILVSGANLTLKTATNEALVWATDLQSGQPLANYPISLYDRNFKLLASGNTDANGIYRSSLPVQETLWEGMYAVSQGGAGANSFAATVSNWSMGIDPWEFNVSGDFQPRRYTSYIYSDRPIYRPGQVVFFKGIVRNENDARFSLPALKEVQISLYNDQAEEVYNAVLPLSAQGTFSGQFQLSDSAGLGYYSINVSVPGETDAYGNRIYLGSLAFNVAAYRRPEFQVNVTSPLAEVAAGSTIPVNLDARFFFGAPVPNATVHWVVLSADAPFQYTGVGRYNFYDYDYSAEDARGPSFNSYGRVIMEKDGLTNAQGQATLEVPADLSDDNYSQRYTIEATVTDINGQRVSGRAEVLVHKGQFYVGIYPQDYVGVAGQPSSFDVIAVDWDSEPVANQKLHVVFNDHQWNCAQEVDPETDVSEWRCRVQDTLVAETDVTTDAQGRAVATFTAPKGGVYQAKVIGTDTTGAQVSASATIWVSDPNAYVLWRQTNTAKIELISDRQSYKPGDTAEILIPSPFQGEALALVTVERGSIMQTEVLRLRSNSTVYRLPITAAHAPDIFVSVVVVKGVDENNPVPAFKAGLIKLSVSPEQQLLTVTLTPDQEKVGPRDTVVYTLKATDYLNKPVQAEFSLALVDLAVLSLSSPNTGPIAETFYGERGLGVRTASGLTLGIERYTSEAEKAKGGGGGGGDMAFSEVRSNFLDTAFWQAVVTTDANGEAKVEIKLPDNLTTWRLDARGLTADTLVGQATVDIVVSKDLLIRPNTPRFFVVGDQMQIGAVVNNNTAQDIDATVTLSARGLTLQSPAQQTVKVAANAQVEVTWDVTAEDAATADLTFSVEGGGLQDASKPTLGIPPEQLLPIYKFSVPETTGTAGELSTADARLEAISLPRRFDVTQGNLALEFSPSLAGSLTGALDYLEHFPYECTEQTVSRFLPNLFTYRALKDLGQSDPALEQKLNALVNDGLQRLYAQQHVDGGWGWWVTSKSDVHITAYVTFGLLQAQANGFAVDANVLSNSLTYLHESLAQLADPMETYELNRYTFVVYVLSQSDRPAPNITARIYDDYRERLSTYALGYLAQALAADAGNEARIQTLLTMFNNRALLSATGAHWEEAERDWWNMNTDTRTTAIVLATLVKLDPENNLIPNVVRWLMTARKAQAWETTQETVWALIGLTDWMVFSKELQGNYEYSVTLNGQLLYADSVNADNVREAVKLQVAVGDLLRDQANRLLINRGGGDGRLYYTAHLNVYMPVEDVRAVQRGVIVSRQYFVQRDDCGGKDQPACPAVTEAKAGDTIQVKVTLVAPNDLYYLVLEDPFPAGAEAVDTSLQTTSVVGERPELDPVDPFYYGWGWWWFSNTDLRDEKVVLFADYLPRGTYEYTYLLHASLPGTFKVIPTQAREFYFPEVFGHGDGAVFTITP